MTRNLARRRVDVLRQAVVQRGFLSTRHSENGLVGYVSSDLRWLVHFFGFADSM
jgi:hypothetical protein